MCNSLLDNIKSTRVRAWRGGLQAHLDEIKRMSDSNRAHTTKAASGKRLDLAHKSVFGGMRSENRLVDFGSVRHGEEEELLNETEIWRCQKNKKKKGLK